LLLATSLADDPSLSPEMRADIDMIAKGIALQAQLVDDLLDITRITGGKLRLDLRPIDAHAALHHAHNILRSEINDREIEVSLEFAAEEHTIKADAVRLQQIFWNVLKNAVKFTPHGGNVTVRTRNPKSKPDKLEVEIIDTGVGIEPAMLAKVFDAFVQENGVHGHRSGGIGLGLAITQRLVETQQGSISARSDGRGRGATFRIEMPLETKAPADAPLVTGMAADGSTAGRHILLIEDHDQTRATISRLLARRGHCVEGVATISAARERAAAGDCDLIISDLGLPDGDGHKLMAELHDTYGLPGIALSGYGMDQDIARSRTSGFFAHLTKPVDIQALESAIAAAPHPVAPDRA
jgi:CheY-like chemotaxis protein